MEKMMKAMWQVVPAQKRVLELNPNIPLVQSIKEEFTKDIKSEKLKDMILYSYNSAVLLWGWELENISDFVQLTNRFAGGYIK
jgi:molecular chaperone HtpG